MNMSALVCSQRTPNTHNNASRHNHIPTGAISQERGSSYQISKAQGFLHVSDPWMVLLSKSVCHAVWLPIEESLFTNNFYVNIALEARGFSSLKSTIHREKNHMWRFLRMAHRFCDEIFASQGESQAPNNHN